MSKFLIVGLGNIGSEYAQTRHNIGFDILDDLVKKHEGQFRPTGWLMLQKSGSEANNWSVSSPVRI